MGDICISLKVNLARSAGRVAPERRVEAKWPRETRPVVTSYGTDCSLGFDTLFAEFILSLSRGFELLNQRSLALS